MKKALVFALVLVLALNLAVPVMADGEDGSDAADTLHELGLFAGEGTAADGTPIYNLGNQATRVQALIMLIRLLGREQEALNCTYKHPFTDVPSWANGYVALASQEHLTNGMTATTFAPNTPASPNMYMTFVLRALGYSDTDNKDFSYQKANDFAREVGLAKKAYTADTILRGDMAVLSLNALSLERKGTGEALIQTLVSSGAVSVGSAKTAGFTVEPPKDGEVVSVKYDAERDMITLTNLREAFPTASKLSFNRIYSPSGQAEWITSHTGYTQEEILLLMSAMMEPPLRFSDPSIKDELFFIQTEPYSEDDVLYDHNSYIDSPFYVFDDNMDVIAVYDPDHPSHTDTTVNFVRKYINSSSLIAEVDATITERLASRNQYEFTLDPSDPQGNGWDDGGGMAYTFPVYLDGKPLTSKCYMIAVSYNKRTYSFSTEEEIYSELYKQELGFILQPSLMQIEGDPNLYEWYFSEKSYDCESYTKSGRTYYGLYCYEKLFDQTDDYYILFMIFDTPYHLVGYTII